MGLEVKYLWNGWVKKDGVNYAKSDTITLTLDTSLILPSVLFLNIKRRTIASKLEADAKTWLMNKIDGIFAIALIENVFKLWGHYSYDAQQKKLRLVGFNLPQDHIILALTTWISFKTMFYTRNILKIFDQF